MMKSEKKISIFWDSSHLWGVLILHCLNNLNIDYQCISAEDIKNDYLKNNSPQLLIVPSGLARYKSINLNVLGKKNIQNFVKNGGIYFGLCGGAGLALTLPDNSGLNLCPWQRKPQHKRLPNFSGYLNCQVNINTPNIIELPVWWPAQFQVEKNNQIEIIASYQSISNDFCLADFPLSGNTRLTQIIDKIHKNPKILKDEPCIIKGTFGEGSYILSYPHLETPNAPFANILFKQILKNILNIEIAKNTVPDLNISTAPTNNNIFTKLYKLIHSIIDKNEQLFSWRYPWLLKWARKTPGIHINTLLAFCHELANKDIVLEINESKQLETELTNFVANVTQLLQNFSNKQHSNENFDIKYQTLFGDIPGYGGTYSIILQKLDNYYFTNL